MAIKTVLVDDFDGTPLASGASSTSFSLDGVAYEIDLAPENVQRLRDALAPFIASARRTGAGATRAARGGSRAKASDPARLAAIREWARENGHAVSDRGRIAASAIEAYEKAH